MRKKCAYYSNKNAFTLAEILIALAVIGVVTAIMIPVFFQDANEEQLKKTWRKVYSDLSEVALIVLEKTNGNFLAAFSTDNEMKNMFAEHLNVIKDCNYGNDALINCINKPGYILKNLNGTNTSFGPMATVILENGVLVRFVNNSASCVYNIGTSGYKRCGIIYVDVNGYKKPNVFGKDFFAIYVTYDSLKPYGISGDDANQLCIQPGEGNWTDPNNKGWGCASRFLIDD